MAHQSGKHVLNLVRVSRLPIFHQLLLEEALLRNTKDNWMIINNGAFQPAIVMGISGKPQELVNIPAAMEARMPVIKRFTGGGTVVVDHDTLFTSLIFQGASLPDVECYPQPIMKWTEAFYAQVFGGWKVEGHGFALRENDYVFGEHKFGGNAQAITGKRWLHHTSLLWDYQPARMALLAHPKKTPEYRQGRAHRSFLMPLRDICCAHLNHNHDHNPNLNHNPNPGSSSAHGAHSPQAHSNASSSQQQQHSQQQHPSQQQQQQERGGVAGSVVDRGLREAEEEQEQREALLGRMVKAAYDLPGFTVQERTVSEASRALQGNSMCGTRMVDLAAVSLEPQPPGTA